MKYLEELKSLIPQIEVNDRNGESIPIEETVSKIISVINSNHKKGNKVILIGNGGSASIASHLTVDFMRSTQINAVAFNDGSLLTCMGNDFGYEYVFEKPIEVCAQEGDILFAISSSGKSKNILYATRMARKKKCFIITLSGFDKNNPLRKEGDFNFYVPSYSYGYVEIIHLVICHLIVEHVKERDKGTEDQRHKASEM